MTTVQTVAREDGVRFACVKDILLYLYHCRDNKIKKINEDYPPEQATILEKEIRKTYDYVIEGISELL
jgi:hypothetical protein